MDTLTIRYFAIIREKLQKEDEEIEIPSGSTVGDLWSVLIGKYPLLNELRPHLRIAVNHEFVSDMTVLKDRAEVALIPPIAGGGPQYITTDEIQIGPIISAVQSREQGGTSVFIGTVRELNLGKEIDSLIYEVYGEMAEKKLAQVRMEAMESWPGTKIELLHRVGTLKVEDVAIVIAASAPHRAEAFAACRYCIDRIKEIVPIWKKEFGPEVEEWIVDTQQGGES